MLSSLCTAAPHLKKIGFRILSDFFEVRGGCTQTNAFIRINVGRRRWHDNTKDS